MVLGLHFKRLGGVIKNFILTLLTVFIFAACSDVEFAVQDKVTKNGNPTNTCTPILPQYGKNLRVSFMVDSSGSTFSTDPNKYYRVKVLNDFIATYGTKTNLNYSYGMFTTNFKYFNPDANSFVVNGEVPFFNSSSLQSALDVYKNLSLDRNGGTYYKRAFAGVKTNTLADIGAVGSPKSYSVVFMSDGKPEDLDSTQEAAALVEDLVMSVANSGGAVRVSGVYFGPSSNNDAKNVMKAIATAGHGQFIDTNVLPQNSIDIADAISIPGEPCGE
ncbi:MAG: hypothetical protein A4S09_09940 [Proteobacteria bacterium SG_bin7]|nr:MAG: hypothetical protein A4S09_09940 [Proteobacteria bacterium SG_bin7]